MAWIDLLIRLPLIAALMAVCALQILAGALTESGQLAEANGGQHIDLYA